MARGIITINGMGKELAWTLVQQARGIPDVKALDDFLIDRTLVLMFARADLSERLCITAAIRQMSGHAIYMGPEENWEAALSRYPVAMLGSMSYYMDGVFIHGMRMTQWNAGRDVTYPVINLGGADAHPAHALADIVCMMRSCRDNLRDARLCWLGWPSGAMFSLMAATQFFPFSMTLCVPDKYNKDPLVALINRYKTDITICDTPREAVRGCNFVMGGSSENMHLEEIQNWRIDANLLAAADKDVRVMAGTNPMHCIPVDSALAGSAKELFLEQAQSRLLVYKRILHWLFEL